MKYAHSSKTPLMNTLNNDRVNPIFYITIQSYSALQMVTNSGFQLD